ncbi:TPA: hypothetical protein ACMDOB_000808 [Vibrio metschnikovii]|nr:MULTISPECIES: hypothetical protein [Vibrio]
MFYSLCFLADLDTQRSPATPHHLTPEQEVYYLGLASNTIVSP